VPKGVGRKFSRGGPTEKSPKNSKKDQNSTIKPLPGGEQKKTSKNSTIKPLPGEEGQRKKDRKIAL